MKENDERRKKTQRSELVLVGFLFLFGIGSIVFGVVRLQGSIQKPFQVTTTPAQTTNLLEGVDTGGVDIEALKAKDTDGDGLSDYEEIYITHSSPYLWSSAGDGVSDKEKVLRGLDPNCPIGKTCFQGTVATQTPINPATPAPFTGTPSDPNAQKGSTTDPTQAVNQVLKQFQNKTPQEIRDFLKTQGMPEDQLSKVPDATLQDIYNQGLDKAIANIKQQGAQAQANIANQQAGGTTPTVSTTTAPPIDPSLLTPQEIRTLLEASGKVPLDILSKVPDSALKDIFLKAVQSAGPQK